MCCARGACSSSRDVQVGVALVLPVLHGLCRIVVLGCHRVLPLLNILLVVLASATRVPAVIGLCNTIEANNFTNIKFYYIVVPYGIGCNNDDYVEV